MLSWKLLLTKLGDELGRKLQDYARLGVSYHIVFDLSQQLADDVLHVFSLNQGEYERLEQPWLDRVRLGLMLWEGTFENVSAT